MYESRSLRSSGIEVPAWLGVSDEGVLVPAVPAGEFFLFSFPGGMASAGPDGFPGILPLLERPVPGLFDLVLESNALGRLGFADPAGGFIPLSRDDLPALPDGMREVRLVVPDGEVEQAAAVLGNHLGLPVWVTSAGAEVRVENGQLVAERAGGPASWVQVLPGGRPDAVPEILTWYRTERGMIQARQGEAVIETSRDDAGRVNGITLADHLEWNALRARPGVLSSVSAGLYGVGVDIVPGDDGPVFLLPDFDGSVARRPLGELPELLGRHGWTVGGAILISSDFTGYAGKDWDALTTGPRSLPRPRRRAFSSPGGGRARCRWTGTSSSAAGTSRAGGGLTRRAGRGSLRCRRSCRTWTVGCGYGASTGGVVSLPLGAGDALRAGVASPTDAMMRGRALGYRAASDKDGPGAFVVDVPLTEGGHIGLAREDPDAGPGGLAAAGPVRAVERMQTLAAPAAAGQVAELIRRAGYQPDRQVIQFLAAPSDDEAHGVFAREALEIAGLIGRDVFIVGAAGATVAYDADREAFAARLAGGAPPGGSSGSAGARPASRARAAAGLLRVRRARDPGPTHRTARQRLCCLSWQRAFGHVPARSDQ